MKRRISIILAAYTILLGACTSDIVYSRLYPIPSGEWHMDSVLRCTYSIPDTAIDYHTTVYVRHTQHYPYQNIWLFIGDSTHRDTVPCQLADDRGRWLGDTHHGLIERPVFIETNRHFTDTGTYTLEIQHAMRDTLLRGVMDVIVEIKQHGQE